ncbi:MAG: hypothetical protein ACFE8L_01745 [Candidatus Hodarchaeota archaeon]
MNEFLKQLGLSNDAIDIYIKAIGRTPLTYYELYSMVPKITEEEFLNCLNELIDSDLIIQLIPQKKEILLKYLTIPPFGPIITYYKNIDANLTKIKSSIQELIANSLKQIFKRNRIIDMDSIFNKFQEIKNDIEEDNIIQKREIEDIFEGMEDLNKLKKELSKIHQQIQSITQTQFSDLLKLISNLKDDLTKKINSLEFKKYKKEIIEAIEELFKARLEEMVGNFLNKLHNQIEDEFSKTNKSTDNIMDSVFQYREDFKMLLLNMLNNFETKMNTIFGMMKENKENLLNEMQALESKITENLNVIVRNSINEVSKLNKPIESVMKDSFELLCSDRTLSDDIWMIRSITNVNEEIQKLINNKNKTLFLIVPNLENHLAFEHFGKQSGSLKIKIASSEAHTNSLVKKLKTIKNLEYKTLQNENIIALKGDDDQIVIGLIQDNQKEPLEDFIGFGSNFEPLINILGTIVDTTWTAAYSDTYYAAQQTKIQTTTPTKVAAIKPTIIKEVKPKVPIKTEPIKTNEVTTQKIEKEVPKQVIESIKNQEKISKPQKIIAETSTPKEKITDLTQKLKKNLTILPKAGDEAGMFINDAFNNLILQLNNLRGEEFSLELQKIADLILEKKGFSVILHQLRSTINEYKTHYKLLNQNEKNQIVELINNWKQKLFQ